MSPGSQSDRRGGVELAHHYVGGDGAAALSAFLDGFSDSHPGVTLTGTQYDSLRLRVKSRILRRDPPSLWTGWPGAEMADYAAAGVLADVTDVWESSGMVDAYRPVVAEASRLDERYYTVPITVHRINDLYVNRRALADADVDVAGASSPTDLVGVAERIADETGGPGILLPMADPFAVLQLWEVTLLGLTDAATHADVTAGNARDHRTALRRSLEHVVAFADVATDRALYQDLTDANEQFTDGLAPLYPQGDWAAGEFDERAGFAYGDDWDRVPFPGTEDCYAVVLDTLFQSTAVEGDAVETVLAYAGSASTQESFARRKGSLPARRDVSMEGFGAFARDQHQQLDRSRSQPLSLTHGLSVTPAQLVDLKGLIVDFIDTWDVEAATRELIEIFDR